MIETNPRHPLANWLAPLAVLITGIFAYSNSLHGPFIFDDLPAIVRNPQMHSLNPWKYHPDSATSLSGRPVLTFSFAVNYALAGTHVEIYHLTNIAIHLAAALVLYAIVRCTLPSHSVRLAALIAAMWVAHPLCTQAVTYTIQRAESLASLFFLLTIYCFIRSATPTKEHPQEAPDAHPEPCRNINSITNNYWSILAILSCALGMATKETVAAAPIVALLYDRAFLAGSFKQALRLRWKTYLGLAATWIFILLAFIIDRREGTAGFSAWVPPIEYARTELNVIAHYLHLAFWPTRLSLDYYDWPIARHWSDVQFSGWLVLALVVFSIIALIKWPRVGFLAASFFLILAPTSSFLPITQEAAAEQRMYLPLAILICLIITSTCRIFSRSKASHWTIFLIACSATICLAELTRQRNAQYATAIKIWTDTVAKRPGNSRARINLGQSWQQASALNGWPPGSPDSIAAYREAAKQFQMVLFLEPRISHAVFELAHSLDKAGDTTAAEDVYTRALSQYPDLTTDLLLSRGDLRARRKDWQDAKKDFQSAIAASPDKPEPHYFLALLYQQLGDTQNAQAELTQALTINPNYKEAASLLNQIRHSSKSLNELQPASQPQ